MKHCFLLLFSFLACTFLHAEKFTVDTIFQNGHPDKYINFVVMGDGFATSEQDFFLEKASELINGIFSESPFSNYKNFFNAYAIRVISKESGVSHPKTSTEADCINSTLPAQSKDTYFKCTFDEYGIHRLLVVKNYSKVTETLADNLPQSALAFVLSNTTEYGGSGGSIAVSSINSYAYDVIKHEMAHAFADLADEYWAGDMYAMEKPNMTKENNQSLIKWKNWLGTNGVGIYAFNETAMAKSWYRPHQDCKMRYLGSPFCEVCKQTLVSQISKLIENVIVAYSPENLFVPENETNLKFELTKLIKPAPNTLQIRWELDGSVLSEAGNQESCQLANNMLTNTTHTLKVFVTDTTNMIRLNPNETRIVNSVTWQIAARSPSGIAEPASEAVRIYASSPGTLQVVSTHPLRQVMVYNLQGARIYNAQVQTNTHKVDGLAAGVYIVKVVGGNTVTTGKIMVK
jgi:hypothetical protein